MAQSIMTQNLDIFAERRRQGVSAVQHVYDQLRHDIVYLKRLPGSTISKKDVTESCGVSPTPVREALLRLADEGLVEIYPQSRTVVSRIDIQHAREILFLRLSTEIEIAKVLVQIIDDGGIARLMAWIDRLETELRAGDQNSFRSADNRFHEEMYALAGVPGLIQVLRARRGHHDRIRGLFLRQADRRQEVIDEHRAIVDALKNRDGAAAEQATRLHLGKSLAIIDEIREQYPDYFF
jgi:DNA-binding GntR family transcriptional regulator